MTEIKIQSARFVKSAVKPSQYPVLDLPEIAFAGRSNVGKSSLINTLVNRRRLVKTSSTPGRTQLINFFSVNEWVCFVDLPGFGYAKVPASVKKNWGPMVEAYCQTRSCLNGMVLIMDIRRQPGALELDLIRWVSLLGIPIIFVLTKTDKLSKNRQKIQRAAASRALGVSEQLLIMFSAKSRLGRDRVWDTIYTLTSTGCSAPGHGGAKDTGTS